MELTWKKSVRVLLQFFFSIMDSIAEVFSAEQASQQAVILLRYHIFFKKWLLQQDNQIRSCAQIIVRCAMSTSPPAREGQSAWAPQWRPCHISIMEMCDCYCYWRQGTRHLQWFSTSTLRYFTEPETSQVGGSVEAAHPTLAIASNSLFRTSHWFPKECNTLRQENFNFPPSIQRAEASATKPLRSKRCWLSACGLVIPSGMPVLKLNRFDWIEIRQTAH